MEIDEGKTRVGNDPTGKAFYAPGPSSRIIVALLLFVLPLFAFIAPGCGGSGPSTFQYDHSPDSVVVSYWTGGGLAPPWVDDLPLFQLFGDGRVVRKDNGDNKAIAVETTLGEDEIQDLLRKIRDAGFFNLEDEYINAKILDAASEEITVDTNAEKKDVRVYMMDIREFDATRDLLMAYPLLDTRDYVPDKGYLVIMESEKEKGECIDPGSDLYAILPGASQLEQAATSGQPIEMDGDRFIEIKKAALGYEFGRFDVWSSETAYSVFPLYQPREGLLPE